MQSSLNARKPTKAIKPMRVSDHLLGYTTANYCASRDVRETCAISNERLESLMFFWYSFATSFMTV